MNATVYQRVPGRRHDRRGVDRLAGRHPADAPRRPGLRLQVEHGLDARLARLHGARADLPAVPPPPDDVLADVRVLARTSCCRSPTTRSCTARARCCARCPATGGSSWPTCAPTSPTCGRTPASSCCSWAASSARSRSGPRRASLDWWLLDNPDHRGVQTAACSDLNRVYRRDPGAVGARLRPGAASAGSTPTTRGNNVFSFLRYGDDGSALACVANFSRGPARGLPARPAAAGRWDEVLNTDAEVYGGSGVGNLGARRGRRRRRGTASPPRRRCASRRSARSGCTTPADTALRLVYETHSTSTDNEAGVATGWLPGELSATGRRERPRPRAAPPGRRHRPGRELGPAPRRADGRRRVRGLPRAAAHRRPAARVRLGGLNGAAGRRRARRAAAAGRPAVPRRPELPRGHRRACAQLLDELRASSRRRARPARRARRDPLRPRPPAHRAPARAGARRAVRLAGGLGVRPARVDDRPPTLDVLDADVLTVLDAHRHRATYAATTRPRSGPSGSGASSCRRMRTAPASVLVTVRDGDGCSASPTATPGEPGQWWTDQVTAGCRRARATPGWAGTSSSSSSPSYPAAQGRGFGAALVDAAARAAARPGAAHAVRRRPARPRGSTGGSAGAARTRRSCRSSDLWGARPARLSARLAAAIAGDKRAESPLTASSIGALDEHPHHRHPALVIAVILLIIFLV